MESSEPIETCLTVLKTAAARAKAAAALAAAASLGSAGDDGLQTVADWRIDLPPRPARPARPHLASPAQVKRRKLGSPAGRAALLHALAHIELNAIDLAFDMALRFSGQIAAAGLDAPRFFADWIAVGRDEARHFLMLAERLEELGVSYGDLPAHDGLWEAALSTADDVLARLVIAPLVLEARGLDVTPGIIAGLERAGDSQSAEILKIIYQDEIGHVAAGMRWFKRVCLARREQEEAAFQRLVAARFARGLKPPFNHVGRKAAGLNVRLYQRGDAAQSGTDFAESSSKTR